MPSSIEQLLARHPLISDQVDERELGIILGGLKTVLDANVAGGVVELGCYAGTTSLFIRRMLDMHADTREFHVYDSFEGLPPKHTEDESPLGVQFKTGELSASRKVFEQHFKRAGLRLPKIHKGWFNELDGPDMPPSIAFAYLDGDYYESIRDSLRLITPRLVPGAVVIIDDYANEALPGAAKAVDEWRREHACSLRVEHSLATLTNIPT